MCVCARCLQMRTLSAPCAHFCLPALALKLLETCNSGFLILSDTLTQMLANFSYDSNVPFFRFP